MANINLQSIINSKTGAKVKGHKGGGKKAYSIGLWQNPQGQERHIKTKALGIDDGQGFILAVENNKIILYTVNDSQVKELEKNHLSVFKSCTKGKKDGQTKWQNYAVIEGIDNDLWQAMVKVNGGVVRHKATEKEWRDKFEVKPLQNK